MHELKEKVDVLQMLAEGSGGRARPEDFAGVLKGLEERARRVEESGVERGESAAWIIRRIDACLGQLERAERIIRKLDSGMKEKLNRWFDGRREALVCALRLRKRREALVLADSLVEARRKSGLSQKEAAGKMGISGAYLSQLERARCNPPSATARERIENFIAWAESAGDVRDAGGAKAVEDKGKVEVYFYSGKGAENGPSREDIRGGERAGTGAAEKGIDSVASTGGEGIEFPGREASGRRSMLLRSLLRLSLRLDEGDIALLVKTARALLGEKEYASEGEEDEEEIPSPGGDPGDPE